MIGYTQFDNQNKCSNKKTDVNRNIQSFKKTKEGQKKQKC